MVSRHEDRAPTTDAGMWDAERRGLLWWTAVAVGFAIMGVAVWGSIEKIFVAGSGTELASFVVWLAAGLVLHDGLVVWLVAGAGIVLTWWIAPDDVRDVVAWGIWVTALLVFAFWPEIAGYGLRADNPSLLPRPYARNALIVVGVIAAGVAGVALVRARRSPQERAE